MPTIVPQGAESQARNAPAALCPACSLHGNGFIRHDSGVAYAHYACPSGHIWITKWAAALDGVA